jgi:hypothetical protein
MFRSKKKRLRHPKAGDAMTKSGNEWMYYFKNYKIKDSFSAKGLQEA